MASERRPSPAPPEAPRARTQQRQRAPDGSVAGVVSERDLLEALFTGKAHLADSVSAHMSAGPAHCAHVRFPDVTVTSRKLNGVGEPSPT